MRIHHVYAASDFADFRSCVTIEDLKQNGIRLSNGAGIPPGRFGHARDARNKIKLALFYGTTDQPQKVY